MEYLRRRKSSGVLYGAYRGMPLGEAVELGNAAAACSLLESGATEGMRTCEEAMALCDRLRAAEAAQKAEG